MVVTVITALSALCSLIGAIMVYGGGKEFTDEYLRQAMEENPEAVGLPEGMTASDVKGMSGALWTEAVNDFQGTLSVRAGMAVFVALCLLLFAIFMLRTGARWARVLITIVAVFQIILPHTFIMGDEPPDDLFLTSFGAVILGLVALIMVWLPPVGRFNKAHKQARRVPMAPFPAAAYPGAQYPGPANGPGAPLR
jgi:hypothetical protein